MVAFVRFYSQVFFHKFFLAFCYRFLIALFDNVFDYLTIFYGKNLCTSLSLSKWIFIDMHFVHFRIIGISYVFHFKFALQGRFFMKMTDFHSWNFQILEKVIDVDFICFLFNLPQID